MCECAVHWLLTLDFPHVLSLPVTQAVHHCPPTKSRAISPSAHSLLSIRGFFPFLLWRVTYLHPLHLSHLIAPLFPSVLPPCSFFLSCFLPGSMSNPSLTPTQDLDRFCFILVQTVLNVFCLSPSQLSPLYDACQALLLTVICFFLSFTTFKAPLVQEIKIVTCTINLICLFSHVIAN